MKMSVKDDISFVVKKNLFPNDIHFDFNFGSYCFLVLKSNFMCDSSKKNYEQ